MFRSTRNLSSSALARGHGFPFVFSSLVFETSRQVHKSRTHQCLLFLSWGLEGWLHALDAYRI